MRSRRSIAISLVVIAIYSLARPLPLSLFSSSSSPSSFFNTSPGSNKGGLDGVAVVPALARPRLITEIPESRGFGVGLSERGRREGC